MDSSLVKAAMEHPNNWVGCSLGDAGDVEAPEHLATKIPTIYQQHNNHFCLTYSLASALFYCGFSDAASILASQTKVFSSLHFDDALSKLKELMLNLVPEIGQPTLYGVQTNKWSKMAAGLGRFICQACAISNCYHSDFARWDNDTCILSCG